MLVQVHSVFISFKCSRLSSCLLLDFMLFAWSNLVFIFHNVVVKITGASPILHFAIPHPFSVRQIRGVGVWQNAKLD